VSRPCSICSHRDRLAIDQELLAGGIVRAISARYGVSHQALLRHRENHATKTMVAAANADPAVRQIALGGSLADQMQALREKGAELLAKAEGLGDIRASLVALHELARLLELACRIASMMNDQALVGGAAPKTAIVFLPTNGRDEIPALEWDHEQLEDGSPSP
jgi:hypothetical protein